MSSAGYVQFKADSEASTRELYAAYKVWCEDNTENPLSSKSFSGFMAQNAGACRLETTNNVAQCGKKMLFRKALRRNGFAGYKL